MRTIYLDSNATSRPDDTVVAAMHEALTAGWPNPSSLHRPGQAARQQIDLARESVAQLLGCRDREVIFTSGGTEADNLAVRGSLAAQPDRPVIVTNRLEHSAVRETAEYLSGLRVGPPVEVVWLDIDARGFVRVDALETLLASRAAEIGIVSIMWASNETGIIQPIETLGAACREHDVRFHVDGVQWVGKMPTDVASKPIDLLSFSAHKFHGPKGVGGLYARRGVRLEPGVTGGPQERERRGGTENVPGIVGLGVAARVALDWLATDERDRLAALRDRFEQMITSTVEDATVNGVDTPRLWNTSSIAFRRLEAEAILMLLSERGVCASAGAACSSGSLDPSPVLLAMGIPPEDAHGTIRFSLSRETTDEEVDEAIAVIADVVVRLRKSLVTQPS